jgi:hypothetical protein
VDHLSGDLEYAIGVLRLQLPALRSAPQIGPVNARPDNSHMLIKKREIVRGTHDRDAFDFFLAALLHRLGSCANCRLVPAFGVLF